MGGDSVPKPLLGAAPPDPCFSVFTFPLDGVGFFAGVRLASLTALSGGVCYQYIFFSTFRKAYVINTLIEHFPEGVCYQYIFLNTIKEAAVHHGKQPHIARHLLQAQLNIVNVLPFLYSVAFLFVFQPHHQVHSLRLQQSLSNSQVFVA